MRPVSALEVENISYAFGRKTALEDINFQIKPGECTILLGPNGAGKTTLFSLITRLYDSGRGKIAINGHDIQRKSTAALAKLGVVFQQPTLDLDLSVVQNLRYHASLHGLSRKQSVQRTREELERQGMYPRRNEKIRQLNGGHRRRVEIARALLHQPSVLLLDEPTVGLDVPSRQAIVDYIHTLCHSEKIAVLWATHLIDEVYEQDYVIVLHHGSIRAKGPADEVIRQAPGAGNIQQAFHFFTKEENAA